MHWPTWVLLHLLRLRLLLRRSRRRMRLGLLGLLRLDLLRLLLVQRVWGSPPVHHARPLHPLLDHPRARLGLPAPHNTPP